MNKLRMSVLLTAIALLVSQVALSDEAKEKKPSPLVEKVRRATEQYLDVNNAIANG